MNKEDKDNLIAGGLLAGMGFGIYKLYKYLDAKETEHEAKELQFKAYKTATIINNDISHKQVMCTLENPNLSEADRAFAYDYSRAYLSLINATSTEEELNTMISKFDAFFTKLMSDDKTAVKAYVRYLRKVSEDKAAEKQSKMDRELEERRMDQEMNKLKLQLKSEENKADAVVKSIEAIAGSNKQSDINVTVNNDNK